MKKIVSLLLTVVMAILSVSSTAFAVSEPEVTPQVTAHKVTLEIPANGTLEIDPDEPVDPDDPEDPIWGQTSFNLSAHNNIDTANFTIPDPHFAYEVSATGSSSGQFGVYLIRGTGGTTATLTGYCNGNTYKLDWISVVSGGSYKFRIYNYTSSTVSFIITYYSW